MCVCFTASAIAHQIHTTKAKTTPLNGSWPSAHERGIGEKFSTACNCPLSVSLPVFRAAVESEKSRVVAYQLPPATVHFCSGKSRPQFSRRGSFAKVGSHTINNNNFYDRAHSPNQQLRLSERIPTTSTRRHQKHYRREDRERERQHQASQRAERNPDSRTRIGEFSLLFALDSTNKTTTTTRSFRDSSGLQSSRVESTGDEQSEERPFLSFSQIVSSGRLSKSVGSK